MNKLNQQEGDTAGEDVDMESTPPLCHNLSFCLPFKQLNSFILSNLYLALVGFYIQHVLIDKQSNRMASAIHSVQAFTFEPIVQNFFHVLSLPLTKYSILLLQATSFKDLTSFRG